MFVASINKGNSMLMLLSYWMKANMCWFHGKKNRWMEAMFIASIMEWKSMICCLLPLMNESHYYITFIIGWKPMLIALIIKLKPMICCLLPLIHWWMRVIVMLLSSLDKSQCLYLSSLSGSYCLLLSWLNESQ
jgi:hypothetical protein